MNSRFEGPTKERLVHSDGYVAIGDDKQGTRVYHMLDSCLDRTYADLRRKCGSGDQDQLLAEYSALRRLAEFWEFGGLMGSVGSIDMEGGVSGQGRSFLAKSERQLAARDEVARAKDRLSVGQWRVVDCVVLRGDSLEVAGYLIGRKSQRRAIEAARIVLRGAGELLAEMWKRR